jgi:hypothetical protein
MTWYQLNHHDSQSERDVNRELAARMPFLLDGELADTDWPDRRCWDLRASTAVAPGLEGLELLALASRMERILVTRNSAFLDDAPFPPALCPGVIVVGDVWGNQLDEFLVTIVGLLGPFRALYHGVKAHGSGAGLVAITSPAGRSRRVTRRYRLDREGLLLLTDLQSTDGQIYGYPGYRRASARVAVLA